MPAEQPSDRPQEAEPGSEITRAEPSSSPLPFDDLHAPEPIEATPPTAARWLAFGAVLLGGLLGGLIGFGVGDILGRSDTWAAIGALVGGLAGAVGVGVIAALTLRAMNEWQAVQHPEDERPG